MALLAVEVAITFLFKVCPRHPPQLPVSDSMCTHEAGPPTSEFEVVMFSRIVVMQLIVPFKTWWTPLTSQPMP